MHAFSSESIPPRGLSLTHLAGKGLLVACHGHEAEKLAGMARIYIYPEPDLRPAYKTESPVEERHTATCGAAALSGRAGLCGRRARTRCQCFSCAIR